MSAITKFGDPLIIKCASYIEDNRTYYNFMSVCKRFQEIGNRDHRECIRRFYEGTTPRPEVLETWLPLPLFSRLLNRSKFTETTIPLPEKCLAVQGNHALLWKDTGTVWNRKNDIYLFDLTTRKSRLLCTDATCAAMDKDTIVIVTHFGLSKFATATGKQVGGSLHHIKDPRVCAVRGRKILIANHFEAWIEGTALTWKLESPQVHRCYLLNNVAIFCFPGGTSHTYNAITGKLVKKFEEEHALSPEILACHGDTALLSTCDNSLFDSISLYNITHDTTTPLEKLNNERRGKAENFHSIHFSPIDGVLCAAMDGDYALLGLGQTTQLVRLSTQAVLASFAQEGSTPSSCYMDKDRCFIVSEKNKTFQLTIVDFCAYSPK